MSDIIDINTVNLLPKDVEMYGPLTEEQFNKVKVKGRVFRLTRHCPVIYREIYIVPEERE
jgi:hypothetical protein